MTHRYWLARPKGSISEPVPAEKIGDGWYLLGYIDDPWPDDTLEFIAPLVPAPDLERVRHAFLNPGRRPDYHYTQMEHLRRRWQPLYIALRLLTDPERNNP